ncbi:hypothetical protein SISSUDRAFT_564166 [Sistotremastrum suecicum HHB10207 ss-3]|uniref:Uncharacterized protein n=1 Tax=Sistotremastrum suecicum HHB10207 ss-3 TaxID=1314776 RepID=A0A166ETN1_9AGAM|nr:hypothetical protein SISSUDRAFT_564166 [Sistotremastrum suecicum HHB10207 ss-3]
MRATGVCCIPKCQVSECIALSQSQWHGPQVREAKNALSSSRACEILHDFLFVHGPPAVPLFRLPSWHIFLTPHSPIKIFLPPLPSSCRSLDRPACLDSLITYSRPKFRICRYHLYAYQTLTIFISNLKSQVLSRPSFLLPRPSRHVPPSFECTRPALIS